MGLKFRVVKHRVTRGGEKSILTEAQRDRLDETLIRPFIKPFVTALGELIKDRIRAGRWHRSKNRRFSYYRTWLQYRYGSDRARKKTKGVQLPREEWIARDYGGKRKNIIKQLQTPGAWDRMPDILRDPVARAQFRFVSNLLSTQANRSPGLPKMSRLRKAPGGQGLFEAKLHRQPGQTRWMMRSSGVNLDVHESVMFLKKFMTEYTELQELKKFDSARELLQSRAHELVRHDAQFTRWSRETKVGQRLMRQAQRRALLIGRNLVTLGGPGGGLTASMQSRVDQADGPYHSNSEQVSSVAFADGRKAKLKRLKAESASGGRITVINASGFPFGFQTGQLSEAWAKADAVVQRMGAKWDITVSPEESGDQTGRGSLTGFLKRIIARQGGRPQLVTRRILRESVQEAAEIAEQVWANHGIYPRGPRG